MTAMLGFLDRVLCLIRGWRTAADPPLPPPGKQRIICIGCTDDGTLLDRLLEPGEYDISFLDSADGAFGSILRARPNKVIFCMRVDDERSLQVLSMLNLDPRTSRIPVLTCVPSITTGCGSEDSVGAGELAPARPGMVMH